MRYILTDNTLALFDNGEHLSLNRAKSESAWQKALEHLKNQDFDALRKLFNVADNLVEYFDGKIKVINGTVRYGDKIIDTYAAAKAINFMQAGLPYEPLLKFIGNLQENPSYRAQQDLYQFLEYGQMPITEDGCFMAYKKVRRGGDGNLYDIYTQTINNNVGATVEIPRNQVDEDPDRTCSRGLHVCSFEYLPHFGAGPEYDVVLAVKVNPKDVVAIPRDYNNTKMRVCKYEVVETVTNYSEHIWSGVDLYSYDTFESEAEFAEAEEFDEDLDESDSCYTPTVWHSMH